MPFLTDRIQATQRDARMKRALEEENLAPRQAPLPSAPGGLASSRFNFNLVAIEQELREKIIGQDHVITSVIQYLRMINADIGDPRKPLATILFAGPTGVGKTETARLIARALYGDADALCRIDMNTLAQEHYAASLTGAPPGYVGSKEGTTILDQDKIEGSRNLPGIVLFDELEKASNEVVLALLNVFDNGILTVASGERTISFRNAIIFMTSNLGAKELAALRTRRQRLLGAVGRVAMINKAVRATRESLLARFPPEFVNRIDQVETFNWIDAKRIPDILRVEVEKLNVRLRKHNCQLSLDRTVVEFLSHQGYDERFGAREIRRILRKHIEFPLAEFMLESRFDTSNIDTLQLVAEFDGSQISFKRL